MQKRIIPQFEFPSGIRVEVNYDKEEAEGEGVVGQMRKRWD